jgi:5-methylcytosine-specific restriction endonuclease McrA
MFSNTNTCAPRSSIVEPTSPLLPNSLPSELTDTELLVATRRLVGRSNQLLAALLAHLGEVEARGVHRTRACSSLYAYCIYELRFSEDEAFRRVSAARLVRRFPVLLDAIAAGELHLTGLLMLGPHLTAENLCEVLARAKHRTKKEIAKLVRVLDPLPEVAARIEPLGPAPARLVPKTRTWAEWVQSLCPVRDLVPGVRPRDWVDPIAVSANEPGLEHESSASASSGADGDGESTRAAPARLEPQRYAVHFTAGEDYVKLTEEACALLSHATPRVTLEELHLRAMQALVAELKKKKYAIPAASTRSRPRSEKAGAGAEAELHSETATQTETDTETGRSSGKRTGPALAPRGADGNKGSGEKSDFGRGTRKQRNDSPRQRGRHVPAAVRRSVYERDAGCCTYTDASGQRCGETHYLELHHLEPFAREGEHTPENLTLRCRAHNAHAAEQDFGREVMQRRRTADRHERWATEAQQTPT